MLEFNQRANPFPGLRPFESTETHLFFGRDGQSEELLRRLKRTRFLAVVGTSGSGKSSLVRAGLLPALQGGLMASAGSDWRIAISRPGNDPIGNLARALSSPAVLGSGEEKDADMQAVLAETTLRRSSLGLVELVGRARTKLDEGGQPLFQDYENLLVVVDQFEELFRFRQLIEAENSKEDAAAFVKLLLEAVKQGGGKIYVVLTMRSDFLGDCSQFQGLPEAINDGQYLIPRMTRDERREAITGPVAVGQGSISEPLVNRLLNDVGDNPDQLPILQHALMRTWDYWLGQRRNGEAIDIPDYEDIGGMAEALSRHADEAYGELSDGQKAIAEKLFKGLTERGADNREIRRPMEVREICELTGAGEAEVVDVIEVFRREGRSFLMPPPTDALTGKPVRLDADSLIDISHESLIRNWERLKVWVDEESQSARSYKRLAETAMLHKAGEEALLVDPALQVALEWREKHSPNAVWARRYHPEFETALSFLEQSVTASDAAARKRALEVKKEATYKRTRWIVVVLGLAFTLSLAALTYANSQLTNAREARSQAEKDKVLALAALGEANSQRKQAMAQAAEANEQKQEANEQKQMAEEEMRRAKEESAEAKIESAKAKEAQQVALKEKQEAERAKAIAVQQADIATKREGFARIERQRAEEEKMKALAAQERIRHLLYAADINLAQQGYETGNLERARGLLSEHKSDPQDKPGFEFNYLWNLLHSEKETIEPPAKGLNGVVASPDGKYLAIGAGNKVELRTVEAGRTKSTLITVTDEEFSLGSLAFTNDGKVLAVGESAEQRETTVKLYDTASGKEVGSLREDRETSESANALVFTPDGGKLVVGGGEGMVRIWDWKSQQKPEVINLDGTVNLALSPDGKTLALTSTTTTPTPSGDSEVKAYPVVLWDMTSNTKKGEVLGHSDTVTSVAFNKAGTKLFSGSFDRTVKTWDINRTWDASKPLTEAASEMSYPSRVFALGVSRANDRLAVGHEDGTISLCRAATYQECATLKGHREAVIALSFSADGKLLFSSDSKYDSGSDGSLLFDPDGGNTGIKSWDVATLLRDRTRVQLPLQLAAVGGIDSIAYLPDGKTLAMIGRYGTVSMLDAETHRALPAALGRTGSATTVALSPDGKVVAISSRVNVTLLNISDKKPIGTPLDHGGQKAHSIAFSPDGQVLATVAARGALRLWNVASRELIVKLRDDGSGTLNPSWLNLAFSADGRSLAFGYNETVEVWDMAQPTRPLLAKIQSEDARVRSLAFTPDGRLLAVGYDGKVVLHDAANSFTKLSTLRVEAAHSLAFSPDGRILATGGDNGTLKLWGVVSLRELLTLVGSPGSVVSVAFSPDGQKLAASTVRTLQVWRAPTEAAAVEPEAAGTSP